MKLKNCIKLNPGLNVSRIENLNSINFYDKECFQNDLNNIGDENYTLKNRENNIEFYKEANVENKNQLQIGDVVIYLPTNQATIVGKCGEKKHLSINFLKVEINQKKLNKEFFIYIFNSSDVIKRQINRETQGNLIQKLSLSSIYNLEIPDLSLEVQKKIGLTFIESMKIKSKMEKYGELILKSTEQILKYEVREKNERRLYKNN